MLQLDLYVLICAEADDANYGDFFNTADTMLEVEQQVESSGGGSSARDEKQSKKSGVSVQSGANQTDFKAAVLARLDVSLFLCSHTNIMRARE